MTAETEIVVDRRGCAGLLILNRPRALNALTLSMVRELAAALDAFAREPGVARVVLSAAGGRAFCAGGDVRWVCERGRAGDYAAQSAFFREEYTLNARIKRFPKPFVSLIDGIVMGGGVGLSLHGTYRVATERAVFAMPEVGIGFFPDVGGSYALPRVPHRIGVAMAATGMRADAADMAALGLATHYVVSPRLAELAEALERPGDTASILAEFASPAPASAMAAQADVFARAFATPDAEAIMAALTADGSPLAQDLLAAMRTKSPTSIAIALKQCELGATLPFEEAMRMEFRIVTRICRGHDFYEGVRATLVDKDNRPQWLPPAGERPAASDIDAYFAPLGAEELNLAGESV